MPLPDTLYRQLVEEELARTKRYERGRSPTALERELAEQRNPWSRVLDGETGRPVIQGAA